VEETTKAVLKKRLVHFCRSLVPDGDAGALGAREEDGPQADAPTPDQPKARALRRTAPEQPAPPRKRTKDRKEDELADPDAEAQAELPQPEPPDVLSPALQPDGAAHAASHQRRAGAEATKRLRENLDKVVGRGVKAPVGDDRPKNTKNAQIEEELDASLNAQVSSQKGRADAFWGEPGPNGQGAGKKVYPNLLRGARHFICLSANNGDVERLFSAAQQLLESKRRRARCGPGTTQQLFLLRANGACLGLKDYKAPPLARNRCRKYEEGSEADNEEDEIVSESENEEEVRVEC